MKIILHYQLCMLSVSQHHHLQLVYVSAVCVSLLSFLLLLLGVDRAQVCSHAWVDDTYIVRRIWLSLSSLVVGIRPAYRKSMIVF